MTLALVIEMLVNGNDLSINQEVLGCVYRESLTGLSTYSMNLSSKDRGKWDELVKLEDQVEILLRFSAVVDQVPQRGSWKKVRANLAKLRYYSDGAELTLEGTDAGVVLSESCHENAFVQKRVSEMVETIARQNKLTPRVAPTLGKFSVYQCGLPDGVFVCETLLPLAVDTNGQGGFLFYVEDGKTLVFTPPRFEQGSDLGTLTLGDISKLEVTRRGAFLAPENARSVQVRGFDPGKKEPVFWLANDTTVPFIKLATKGPVPAELPARVVATPRFQVGDSPPGVAKNIGVALWSEHCQSLFRTQVVLPPTVDAKVGKLVNLDVRGSTGDYHFSSGRWLVYEVEYFRKAALEGTILRLERRTYYG